MYKNPVKITFPPLFIDFLHCISPLLGQNKRSHASVIENGVVQCFVHANFLLRLGEKRSLATLLTMM